MKHVMFCCIFKQVKTAIEEIASGKICMSIKKLQLSVEKKDGIISVRMLTIHFCHFDFSTLCQFTNYSTCVVFPKKPIHLI